MEFAVGSAVFRGSASNPSCTATHNLLGACGSQRCSGVRQHLLCFSKGKRCWRVHGGVGEKMDWAFWGSALCPMGCRLGRDVLGSWAEQGFAQFQGPIGVPDSSWLLLLSSPGCFLVKMWEEEFWKSLCVGS